MENNAEISENERAPQIGSNQLRYTVWIFNYFDQIPTGYRNIQIWKRFPPVEHECQLWNMSIHVPFRRELSVRFVFTKTPGASVLDCGSKASSPHHLMLHLTSSAQSVMDPQCVRNTICLKAV